MFKERKSPSTTVSLVKKLAPSVVISANAITKMKIYVDECDDEIGWLGTAFYKKETNMYYIDDVYLFEQDVHGATTEITPEGLSDFAEELLKKGDEGIEIWNNLKVWGHSHVNMGVTPSSQDNSQMETFKEGGHDWFLRLIANKKGEMKIDLYNYETGISYIDLPWVEITSDEEHRIQKQIDELYEKMDAIAQEREKEFEGVIKEEMKTKVRKLVVTQQYNKYMQPLNAQTHVNGVSGDVQHKGKWGYWYSGTFYAYKDQKYHQKKNNQKKTQSDFRGNDSVMQVYENFFDNDDQVEDELGVTMLREFGEECKTLSELENELDIWGYYNIFTAVDLARIYRVAKSIARD